MKFSFLSFITILFLATGCTHKEAAPEAKEKSVFDLAESKNYEVKNVPTPKQKTKQQLAKEINQNEKNCDKGETQACWKLVTTRLSVSIEKSFYSPEKAEAAFQKLCKPENITCFKNDVKVKEAKGANYSKDGGATLMYTDQGKFKSYSYKEYSN